MCIYIGLKNIDGVQYGEGYYILQRIEDGVRKALIYADRELTKCVACVRYEPSWWLKANGSL